MNKSIQIDRTKLDNLLSTWEEVYKRGLLSFWILLLLQDEKSYAYEMVEKIDQLSKGSISVDEKSIYRALSRFEKIGVLQSKRENSDIGPPRKYYFITRLGECLLKRFINRNLFIFYEPEIQENIFNMINKTDIVWREDHE